MRSTPSRSAVFCLLILLFAHSILQVGLSRLVGVVFPGVKPAFETVQRPMLQKLVDEGVLTAAEARAQEVRPREGEAARARPAPAARSLKRAAMAAFAAASAARKSTRDCVTFVRFHAPANVTQSSDMLQTKEIMSKQKNINEQTKEMKERTFASLLFVRRRRRGVRSDPGGQGAAATRVGGATDAAAVSRARARVRVESALPLAL